MKHLTVLILISFLVQVTKAQMDDPDRALLKNKCKHQHLSLRPTGNKNKKQAFPFGVIQVVDYRTDSSRIGLFVTRGLQHDLLFRSSASNVIGSFLNEDYTSSLSSKTLLVVIRKLWLSDMLVEQQLDEITLDLRSRISFRAETYIKDGAGYVPLAYFDTVITSSKSIMEIAPFRLPALMTIFIKKINSLDISPEAINNKRRLSYAAIDSFSSRHFSNPIDTAKSLREGVYASFEDFKNNKPSIFNYKLETEKNSFITLHLTDEQGKPYYTRKMWGYCDGQQLYVMMDGNLFPVLTFDRAYYVYGSKEYMVKKYSIPLFLIFPLGYATGLFTVDEEVSRKMRFFRIDMERGEIF